MIVSPHQVKALFIDKINYFGKMRERGESFCFDDCEGEEEEKKSSCISLTQKTSVQTSENVSTFSPRSPPATVEATLTTAAAATLTTAITATTGPQ